MFSERKSILVAAEPFEGESPKSWLMRTATKHCVNYRGLLRAVNVPEYFDPDRSLSAEEICRVSAGTAVEREAVLKLVTHGDRTCGALRGEGLLLYTSDHWPTYRFCRSCLASDRIPFLRFCWRLKDWLICPLHRESLYTRCPHCSEEVSFTGEPVTFDENCIACCRFCAGNLAELDQDFVQTRGGYDKTTFIVQDAIFSIATTGTFRVVGFEEPLSIYFYYWLRENCRWLEMRALMCQRPEPNLKKLILDMLEVYEDYCIAIVRKTRQLGLGKNTIQR